MMRADVIMIGAGRPKRGNEAMGERENALLLKVGKTKHFKGWL